MCSARRRSHALLPSRFSRCAALAICDGALCLLTQLRCYCHQNREEFLAAFCNAYEPMEELFQQQGFEPFMNEYLQKWLHTNQVVQVSSDAVGATPGATVPAVIKGLTATGCLLAESEGNRLELYPDGNSFDFLSGLLTRKL